MQIHENHLRLALYGVGLSGIFLGGSAEHYHDKNGNADVVRAVQSETQAIQSAVDNYVLGEKVGTLLCKESHDGKTVEISHSLETISPDALDILRVQLGPNGSCHGVLPKPANRPPLS